jgi:hypothetical protein
MAVDTLRYRTCIKIHVPPAFRGPTGRCVEFALARSKGRVHGGRDVSGERLTEIQALWRKDSVRHEGRPRRAAWGGGTGAATHIA